MHHKPKPHNLPPDQVYLVQRHRQHRRVVVSSDRQRQHHNRRRQVARRQLQTPLALRATTPRTPSRTQVVFSARTTQTTPSHSSSKREAFLVTQIPPSRNNSPEGCLVTRVLLNHNSNNNNTTSNRPEACLAMQTPHSHSQQQVDCLPIPLPRLLNRRRTLHRLDHPSWAERISKSPMLCRLITVPNFAETLTAHLLPAQH